MRSHIGWEYLLVLQVFLQGDAARHDGCELDVVHGIGTGVFGQVFFQDLAPNPANPSDKAGDGCGVEERLHELVVRHGGVYLGFQLLFVAILTAAVPMAVAAAAAAAVVVAAAADLFPVVQSAVFAWR